MAQPKFTKPEVSKIKGTFADDDDAGAAEGGRWAPHIAHVPAADGITVSASAAVTAASSIDYCSQWLLCSFGNVTCSHAQVTSITSGGGGCTFELDVPAQAVAAVTLPLVVYEW